MNDIYFYPKNITSLKYHLTKFENDTNVKSVLFFMADKQRYTESEIDLILKDIKKPIIGGIFPELIFKGQKKKTGVLLIPLQFELKTQIINLSDSSESILNQLEITQKNSITTSSSLFVFYDALSENKSNFIETLFNFFGVNPTYIGGGAGSLNFNSFPCIISNKGLHKNAAIIGWSKTKIAIGATHGWRSISTPLKVTKTNKNEIIDINWKPAFEIYKEIVELHSNKIFNTTNFFEIAKSYPLGISKIDAEKVVRDPYKTLDNKLYLIDKVNEGEYIEVLNGNTESLINSAISATEKAFLNSNKKEIKTIFCLDCISRSLYMEDNFDLELNAVEQKALTSGILSIGEIANSGESVLEIFNKTIVIAIW
ncbi:FIST C-terminal domain-containing protein [Lutibacter sp. A64]|uniref:FIST signal transduction protein n=1 Tax=Lutibacter sp. A64 TaxID=2918526 RepID=UPI001F05B24B|nr:FIST N-terminal domain-containing protein [Lutibacter sp. A64]UMB54400.1 FIST C-terminal domain-containing protein [Lutibacter sp. A64]